MQASTYFDLYGAEDTLWRSVATRQMIGSFWKCFRPARLQYNILEVGSGTGAMLQSLSCFGRAFGMDREILALNLCRKRGIRDVVRGDAGQLPFGSGTFDLVVAVDVIEHLPEPQQAFTEMARVLEAGGLAMTVIPAFQFLWSERDVRLGHRARYTTRQIRAMAVASGFKAIKLSYINLFYFPLLYGIIRLRKRDHGLAHIKTDVATVPKVVNGILRTLLNLETIVLHMVNFPIGCSTLGIFRKEKE